jgi:GNAT superfamily N-acetyltransferase
MPPAIARGRVTIREIVDEHDPAIGPAYALLKRFFARGERVDRNEWIGSLREGAGRLVSDLVWHLLVAERDGEVIGLASGSYLGSFNVGVIGYLAAVPEARVRGLGSRLRERLRVRFVRDAVRIADAPLAAIIGEVSVGNRWLRNLAARPGVILLDFPYYQPSLREDDAPSSFVLYYESLAPRRTRVPVSELRRLLYAVWRRVYRIPRPLDRPAFRLMLRALEGRRTVGSRILDQ